MANPRDPYDRDHLQDPLRSHLSESEPRSPAEIDNELQADPEMAEGPTSNGRIALYAVGIAVVLAAVFYGLNRSTMQQQASTAPQPATSQSSPSTAPPAAPPGMRDVTPRANSQPGTTTGAAPANPPNAPASK